MDTPHPEASMKRDEYIDNTSPPSDFEHCGLDTPKPPKVKLRNRTPFLNKILNRGSSDAKNRHPEPVDTIGEEMETGPDQRVSFQLEVETIPMETTLKYSSESEEEGGMESSNTEENGREEEDDDKDEIPSEVDESQNSSGYVAADEAEDSSSVKNTSASPTLKTMVKKFVFVDIGPNISDTVREFTHLLVDAATRNKSGTIGLTMDKE